MELTEILRLAVVGGLASWFLEYVTKKLNATQSKIVTVVVCLIVGTLYMWLSSTDWLPSVVGVLVAASTIYAFYFKKK